jgi:predicted nucleic-acid-binding Zn-ribbon protein
MSEDGPNAAQADTEDKMDLDFDHLVEQKLNNFGDHKCPTCGNADHEIIGPGLFVPMGLRRLSSWNPLTGFKQVSNLPCVSVVCTACGFTSFYNVYALLGNDVSKFPSFPVKE